MTLRSSDLQSDSDLEISIINDDNIIMIVIIIMITKIIIPRCNMTWRYLTIDGEDATPDVVADVTSFFRLHNFFYQN